jgi:hypothetical protein
MRYVITVLLTLVIAAAVALAWQRDRLRDLGDDLAKAQTQVVIAGFETNAAKADVRVITQYVDRERVIREVIHDIQREAPRYVSPSTDAAYPLPVGFVRLHDAAATARLPGPPEPADAQASTVTASDAATVIASNYGTCQAIREQLIALIDRLQAPPYRGTTADE